MYNVINYRYISIKTNFDNPIFLAHAKYIVCNIFPCKYFHYACKNETY